MSHSTPLCVSLQSHTDSAGVSVWTMEARSPGPSAPLHVSLRVHPDGSAVLQIRRAKGGVTPEELKGIAAVGRAAYLGRGRADR